MRGKYFLLGFLLLKVMALVCKADGEPGLLGGFVMIATSNGSREEESVSEETPHTEDKCRGYFDVMGQWDPPFICKTENYLYCCGTCGFRFCCSYKHSRLDQSTCKNYDTPVWMKTGQTPYNKMNKMHDSTKDKTNLIVYIICGVVAIMALVGIFTKLGLEKAHRPQRENMSRAVASVLQGGCPGEQYRGEEALGMHSQHFVSRATNLQGGQINNNVGPALNMGQQHPYPALSQLAHVYEQQQQTQQQQQQQQNKDLNKYASLKAVGLFSIPSSRRVEAVAAKARSPKVQCFVLVVGVRRPVFHMALGQAADLLGLLTDATSDVMSEARKAHAAGTFVKLRDPPCVIHATAPIHPHPNKKKNTPNTQHYTQGGGLRRANSMSHSLSRLRASIWLGLLTTLP
ncbi:protein shisa-9A-like [Sphaeramia orbicularis]|uniref:protein shisa-9A-like n=1 Tax=Sphaeramia orbicularis TaxID=375764 RepID=UPI00117DF06B|nr:protein shisa-9A-like [Sphaeramia orbicularis]